MNETKKQIVLAWFNVGRTFGTEYDTVGLT